MPGTSPASAPPVGWGADGPNRSASNGSRHGVTGAGAANRRGPTGGAAYGTPRNTCTGRPSGSRSTRPRTGPSRVSTMASAPTSTFIARASAAVVHPRVTQQQRDLRLVAHARVDDLGDEPAVVTPLHAVGHARLEPVRQVDAQRRAGLGTALELVAVQRVTLDLGRAEERLADVELVGREHVHRERARALDEPVR